MTTNPSGYSVDIPTNKYLQNTKKENVIYSVFDNSEYAVFGVNAKGNIGYLNKRFNELFGLPKNSAIQGMHCSNFLCGGDVRCANKCSPNCEIKLNIEIEQQIKDFQINIKDADGIPIKISLGTSYFYQHDSHEVSTYFSIKEIA